MERKVKTMRTFSTEFKKEKVTLIQAGKLKISELSLIYGVSKTSVYNWIKIYSTLPKTEKMVVEKVSEERKNIELVRKIAELESIIGKQQISLIYLESVISCGTDLLGEDLIKKFKSQQ